MKHSIAQANYLNSVALFDAALEAYSTAGSDEEMAQKEQACFDAGDLMEFRQVELFRWAREKVVLLCKSLGKSESDLKAVLDLYDKAIGGEWIHPHIKNQLIERSLQIIVK